MPKSIMKWIGRIVTTLFVVFLVWIGVATIFIVNKNGKLIASSESLRAQIKTGMKWDDVATILEADPNWIFIRFDGETDDCTHLQEKLGVSIKRSSNSHTKSDKSEDTSIKNLIDDSVIARVKTCKHVTVSQKPRALMKVDFSISFSETGEVIATTKSEAWD